MSDLVAFITGDHGRLHDASTLRVGGETVAVPAAVGGMSDEQRIRHALHQLGYTFYGSYLDDGVDIECEAFTIRVRPLSP